MFTFYSLPTFEIKNEEEYVSKCFFRGNFIEYAFGGLVAAGYDCRQGLEKNIGTAKLSFGEITGGKKS